MEVDSVFLGVLLYRAFEVRTTETITGAVVYCVGCGGGNYWWPNCLA